MRHHRAVGHVILLVAVATGTACFRSDEKTSSREGLVKDDAAKAVPLTTAVDPPTSPPVVELQRGSGAAGTVQRGVRYAGEWLEDGKLQRLPETTPLPWPDAACIFAASRISPNGTPLSGASPLRCTRPALNASDSAFAPANGDSESEAAFPSTISTALSPPHEAPTATSPARLTSAA